MTALPAVLAFVAAAGLLTLTPGLDTALVLRTAAAEGPRRAMAAAVGIGAGCLVWGLAAALGAGALLAASTLAYAVLKWAGAAYLLWLGVQLILKPRTTFDAGETPAARGSAMLRGLTTNLLNSKVGVFYVSFLPQFVPAGVPPAPWIVGYAALHVTMGLAWMGVVIAATRPIGRWLRQRAVVRALDRATGAVFVAFGLRLALERR